jgi:hypothetical protein
LDLSPIGLRISAIYIPPGQVDDDIGTVDFSGPRAGRFPVPGDNSPGSAKLSPAEHDHFMLVGNEGTREQRTYLSAASGDYDLHCSASAWFPKPAR